MVLKKADNITDLCAILCRMRVGLGLQYLKADLCWASFKTLEQLQTKLEQLLTKLTPEIVASITGYSFILDALSVVSSI